MSIESPTSQEIESLTEAFLSEVVKKMTTSVSDVVARKDNGHFQIHFSSGQLTRIRKDVTI